MFEFAIGGAAIAAVAAYVQTIRIRSAKRALRSAEVEINHLRDIIDDLKSTDSKLNDPDERDRLLDKISQ